MEHHGTSIFPLPHDCSCFKTSFLSFIHPFTYIIYLCIHWPICLSIQWIFIFLGSEAQYWEKDITMKNMSKLWHSPASGTLFSVTHAKALSISQFTQPCPTLGNPKDCSTPGFPVHHQLPELTQTHNLRVGDTIQPSHQLSSPSSPTFKLSQHQGLFRWVSSSLQVAKVLEFQPQRQSFQWILRTDFLHDWLVWSPWSPRDSQESSPPPQFKSINFSALSFIYSPTLTSIHNYWTNYSFH